MGGHRRSFSQIIIVFCLHTLIKKERLLTIFCNGFSVIGGARQETFLVKQEGIKCKSARRKFTTLRVKEKSGIEEQEKIDMLKNDNNNELTTYDGGDTELKGPTEDNLSREILTMEPSDLEIVFFCDSQSVSCPSDLTVDSLVQREETDKDGKINPLDRSVFPLVDMMRASANYVANHRGTVSVVHIDAASYMDDDAAFRTLMDDLALTWLLGMKLVLVLGCDTPIYERCDRGDEGISYQSTPAPDRDAGWLRFELERILNGCIRPHLGLGLGGDDIYGGNVVSSGSFFTAAPYKGSVTKDKGYPVELQTRKLHAVLERNDIVLLTSVGLSTSNDDNAELVHVQSETLAAYVASTLAASKLVFVSHNHDITLQNVQSGNTIQNFCLKDAKEILRNYNFHMSPQYVASLTIQEEEMPLEHVQFLFRVGWAALALQNGAERAHIVGPSDGALLTELFTPKDGKATCIVQDDVLNEEGLLHPDEDFGEAANSSIGDSMFSDLLTKSKSSLPPPLQYRPF